VFLSGGVDLAASLSLAVLVILLELSSFFRCPFAESLFTAAATGGLPLLSFLLFFHYPSPLLLTFLSLSVSSFLQEVQRLAFPFAPRENSCFSSSREIVSTFPLKIPSVFLAPSVLSYPFHADLVLAFLFFKIFSLLFCPAVPLLIFSFFVGRVYFFSLVVSRPYFFLPFGSPSFFILPLKLFFSFFVSKRMGIPYKMW